MESKQTKYARALTLLVDALREYDGSAWVGLLVGVLQALKADDAVLRSLYERLGERLASGRW